MTRYYSGDKVRTVDNTKGVVVGYSQELENHLVIELDEESVVRYHKEDVEAI